MEHQATTDVLSVLFDVRDKISEFRSEMEHQIKELNLKEQVSLAIGGPLTCIICKEHKRSSNFTLTVAILYQHHIKRESKLKQFICSINNSE